MYRIQTANRRVEKEIARLEKPARERVVRAIKSLEQQPRPANARQLAGNLKGVWRIRVGSYRVLYDIDDQQKTIVLLAVLHRREAYR
jgi:mRNA interferase RelE/StbE